MVCAIDADGVTTIFCVKLLKFFDADPGSQDLKIRIQDSGSGINIPDPQHWFAYEKGYTGAVKRFQRDCFTRLERLKYDGCVKVHGRVNFPGKKFASFLVNLLSFKVGDRCICVVYFKFLILFRVSLFFFYCRRYV